MSRRTTRPGPIRSSVKRSVNSVLPTPVGPRNRKLAFGRPGVVRPSSPCWSRSATRSMALSCPVSTVFNRDGRLRSLSRCSFVSVIVQLPFYFRGLSDCSARRCDGRIRRGRTTNSTALHFQLLAHLHRLRALPDEERILRLHPL